MNNDTECLVTNIVVVGGCGGSGGSTVRTAVDIGGLLAVTEVLGSCSLGADVLGLVFGIDTGVVLVIVKVAEQDVQRRRQNCSEHGSKLGVVGSRGRESTVCVRC